MPGFKQIAVALLAIAYAPTGAVDPDDIHAVGRNASQTQPAKFLMVLLKDKNAPFFIPE